MKRWHFYYKLSDTSLSFAAIILVVTNPISSSLSPFGLLISTAPHETIPWLLTTFKKNSLSYLWISRNWEHPLVFTQRKVAYTYKNRNYLESQYLIGNKLTWICSRISISEGRIGLYTMDGRCAELRSNIRSFAMPQLEEHPNTILAPFKTQTIHQPCCHPL